MATKIEELEAAFARGDYGRVTKDAPALASSSDHEVKRRATALLAKTKPDPTATWLFVVAALLLVAMTVYFETRPEAKGVVEQKNEVVR